jgi:small subunit ribosomal protein S6
MRERRRTYELMYIISPLRSSAEEITTVIGRVQQSVAAAGGEVISVDHGPPWGRRKFAYPIREYAEGEASRRNFTEGYYVLSYLILPSGKVAELERALRLNDAILRFLLTMVDPKGQAPAFAVAAPVAAAVDGVATAPTAAPAAIAAADADDDEAEEDDADDDLAGDEDEDGEDA